MIKGLFLKDAHSSGLKLQIKQISLFSLIAVVSFHLLVVDANAMEIEVTKEKFEITLDLEFPKIDYLGASPSVPWNIHMGSINIRNAPTAIGSKIVGVLRSEDELSGQYIVVSQSDEEWLQIKHEGEKAYVSRMGFSRVHPQNKEMIKQYGNLPYGKELVNRWWGIPIDYEPDDLVMIPAEFTSVEGRDYPLRKEATESLVDMLTAMKDDGLEAFISSAYRAGTLQQTMFLRVMNRDLSQRGTAPPGHSEHQLGTTVDIVTSRGARRALRNTDPQYDWLVEHAAKYGWSQTYRADNTAETGYIEEPWHWRYMGR